MRGDRRRGAALIFVLGLLVVLGLLATEVGRAARLEAAIVTGLRSRTVARYAAESGVAAAATRIERLLDSARSPAERAAVFGNSEAWLRPLHDVGIGGARFGVAVVDLNGRIDLNRGDEATLRGLFEQFTSAGRADVIVSALRAEPLRRLGELVTLPGVDDSLALRVAPYVTLWGDGVVNVNSAPEPVLAALPGLGPSAARSIVRRRESGEVFTSSASVRPPGDRAAEESDDSDANLGNEGGDIVFASAPPPLLVSTSPGRLLIVSRGWQEGHPLTHEVQAVYAIVNARLVLVAWQERDL